MPHSYISEYPESTAVDPGIKTFFEDLYRTSDDPNAHERYANLFTRDAILIMGSKKAVGREEILAFRKSLWTAVKSRLHTVIKIFPFGTDSTEFMVYGSVAYTFKDGKSNEIEWAGRVNMTKEDGEWKPSFYQVYLDTAAQAGK
ncbi:hypothetical protein F5884DRAFT_189448 [Xylogone sp. PMI_703]|nr:hypothetical protein F5884DRAFT_189448 [Xylogone sp. PMI_703]